MIAVTVAFLVAMAVTSAVTPVALKLAVRFGAMAVPRSRDVHTTPMPRLGGIAIYCGVLVATLLTVTARHFITHGTHGWTLHLVGVLAAGTLIALVGIVDDLKDLKPLSQALAILAAGSVLVLFGVRIEGITNPLLPQSPGSWRWIELPFWLSVAGTLFWVFVVTKTVDAIDGLDGLAAGVSAISAGTLALLAAASHQPEGPAVALLAASVAGSCVGFLRYNRYPARIFMSTVGAQFLGLMLASISILGTFKIAAAISVLVPLLVLGVPIFDYAVVLVRRLLNRAPLTAGDRRHLHHRLLEHGLTHRQAVWVIYGCTALLCVAALLIFRATH